jgi:hypothetical protein
MNVLPEFSLSASTAGRCAYAADGSFAFFAAKVFTAPHLPLAMTACGPGGAAIEFGYLVTRRWPTFDALIENIGGELRD